MLSHCSRNMHIQHYVACQWTLHIPTGPGERLLQLHWRRRRACTRGAPPPASEAERACKVTILHTYLTLDSGGPLQLKALKLPSVRHMGKGTL